MLVIFFIFIVYLAAYGLWYLINKATGYPEHVYKVEIKQLPPTEPIETDQDKFMRLQIEAIKEEIRIYREENM